MRPAKILRFVAVVVVAAAALAAAATAAADLEVPPIVVGQQARGTAGITGGQPLPVDAAPIQGGSLQLRKSFFQNLLNGFARQLERTVTGLDFPEEGTSSCANVLINAGKWFDSVAVPNATAAVSGVSGAPTSIRLSASGVSVKGLGGSKSWSSLKDSSVAGAWSTCFQLCFGASPFTITTGLSSKPRFNVARGRTTTVSVDDAALGFDDSWALSPVQGMCIGSQTDFDNNFRKGAQPTLSKAVPTMSKVVADAFNSVMANSTATGFDALYVEPASGTVTLSNGPPPPSIPIPMPGGQSGNSKSSVKATVTLDATALPGMTTASCVQQKPCGVPTGHGTTKMQYTECGACLKDVNGTVYFAFESDAGFAQPASDPVHAAATFLTMPTEKESPRIRRKPHEPRHHRPRRFQHQAAAPSPLTATNAIESRTFNTLALMSKAMTTAGAEAASLLQGVTVTPVNNGGLPGAGDYCHVTHGGFSWSIPHELEINAVATNATTPGAAATVSVEIPALGSIGGSGDFSTWCLVGLPLGTPFRDTAKGQFTVSMAPPSGTFRVTVSVGVDGTVTVVDYPELTFTASVKYANEQREFSFAPYLENLFVGSVKDAAVEATREVLRGKITDLWTAKLSALLKTTTGAKAINTAPTSMGDAVTLTTAAVQPAEDEITLDALVQTSSMGTYAGSANAGLLMTVAPAAPFSVDNCARRATCSAAPAAMRAPLNDLMEYRNCTACVTTKQGQLVLGTKFAMAFDAQAPPSRAVPAFEKAPKQDVPKPSIRRVRRSKRQASAVAAAPSTPDFDSVFYAGKAILSQATAAAGAATRQAFTGYAHPQQSDLGLPYVQNFCNVSHPEVRWADVAATITPTVTNIAPAGDGAVELTVTLDGLQESLKSADVAFTTGCAIGTSWPAVFAEQQHGTASVALAFNAANVTLSVRAEVMTNPISGPLVDTVVLAMTPFTVTGTYAYATGGDEVAGFTLDAYVKNYFETALPQAVATEMQQTLQEQMWAAVDRALGDLVTDTMHVSKGCNVSSYAGTHLVVARGPTCGAGIPPVSTATPLVPTEFMYLLDAGAVPAGVASNHTATQRLPNCTAAMPLGAPLSSTVQLTECDTSSAVVAGRVVLAVHGGEPLKSE